MFKAVFGFLFIFVPNWVSGFVFQSAISTSSCRSRSNPCPVVSKKICPQEQENYDVKTTLWMSSEEMAGGDPPKRRRKRKKKVEKATTASSDDDTPESDNDEPVKSIEQELDLKPRESTGVEFQVRDVRDIVGGVTRSEPSVTVPDVQPAVASTTTSTATTIPDSGTSSPSSSDDSFERLLEDARRMKEESGGAVDAGSGEESMKAKVRNVLSTIVTADFFVVFAFLLWFLAGIFSRTFFQNDAIQIAFNNNFELLVQPALGVLMLGTIVGNYLKDGEEED